MSTPEIRGQRPNRTRELLSYFGLATSVMVLIAVLPIVYSNRSEIQRLTITLDSVRQEIQETAERVRLVERKVYLGENPSSPPPPMSAPQPPRTPRPQNPR